MYCTTEYQNTRDWFINKTNMYKTPQHGGMGNKASMQGISQYFNSNLLTASTDNYENSHVSWQSQKHLLSLFWFLYYKQIISLFGGNVPVLCLSAVKYERPPCRDYNTALTSFCEVKLNLPFLRGIYTFIVIFIGELKWYVQTRYTTELDMALHLICT